MSDEDVTPDFTKTDEDVIPGAKELESKAKKMRNIGIVMILPLVMLPILVYGLQFLLPFTAVVFIIIAFAVNGILGIIILGWFYGGWNYLSKSFEILRVVGNPVVITDRKIAVAKGDGIYAIGKWASNLVMLFAFKTVGSAIEPRVRIPGTVWLWEYKLKIASVNVARREGTFVIPDEDGHLIEGDGIVYCIRTTTGGRYATVIHYTPSQIRKIVDHLRQELNQPSWGFNDTQ